MAWQVEPAIGHWLRAGGWLSPMVAGYHFAKSFMKTPILYRFCHATCLLVPVIIGFLLNENSSVQPNAVVSYTSWVYLHPLAGVQPLPIGQGAS
jgi:hypothetical protein